ncbi:MAG: polyphosphate kinase 2, partial [Hyphomicrobiales bacterium]
DRWDDYTEARDDMFKSTDTDWAPWFVAVSDDKKRARLNIIKHFLNLVPYENVPRPKIKFPTRKIAKAPKNALALRKMVPEAY